MKGREVLLGTAAGREAAALIVDGLLEDLLLDHDHPRPGTIYRARADRPIKGMGGLFLATPDGNAFLRGAKGISPGQMLLVQVSGHAEPGKAIPVTPRLLFKSRYAIVTPGALGINVSRAIRDAEARAAIRIAAETQAAEQSGHGIILRSACADGDPDAIAEDVDAMLSLADAILGDDGAEPEKLLEGPGPHELAWRDWAGRPRDGVDLSDHVAEARRPVHRLPGGASVAVEPTRALVAVDVNTGADTSPAAGLKANIAAARTLPRLLRVKGLGGQIVLDPAPMPKRDRPQVEAALRAALRADEVETALVGWTAMGHYELNRKRARLPLHDLVGAKE